MYSRKDHCFLMRSVTPIFSVVLCLTAVAGTACRTAGVAGGRAPIVQPGAPGQATRVISAEKASDLSRVQFTPADVRFMQGMIGHHAQALEMAALLPERTSRDDMRLLAKRIEVSQADEIAMMRHWLEARGQEVPGPHAHHSGAGASGGAMMPGMLTSEEMSQLAAAKGDAFDRLFLELMIKHHEGALTMVKELYATPGAGQESEIYAFASDVDADQRMEIERMRGMLVTPKEPQG
jgi:uncharacterized protein (DUF305 family)